MQPLAERVASAVDAGPGGDLFERAVAAIVIQPVRLVLAGDEEVEPAVVVVVGPGGARWSSPGRAGRPRCVTSVNVPSPLLRSSVGRIGQCGTTPRGDEDVEPAVVVVIGLIADEPAELVGHARPASLRSSKVPSPRLR